MIKKWIGTQIVLNNIDYNELQKKDYLKKKLSLAKNVLDLDALIIWPDTDYKNLDLVKKFCRELNIKTYLWYSILADTPLFEIKPDQAVETFDRLHGYGINGNWEKLGQGEEKFLFLCPNDNERINRIFCHFQDAVKKTDLGGVFLDRIRFPSPANGLETLYTCFCPYCQEKFYSDYQEELNNFRDKAYSVFRKFQKMSINDLNTYQTLASVFIPDNMKKFFDFRKNSIKQITERFSNEAKRRGKMVGLDLFSPSLATLVGQGYNLLAETCDWIKPMVYCHARGPAGLPLELSSLIKAIMKLSPNLKETQIIKGIGRMMGVNLPETIKELLQNGVPEIIIQSEILKIKNLFSSEKVKIHLGWEAVQMPDIVHINHTILKKYLSLTQELSIEGVVISWNLLQIPDDNLKLVGDFLLRN